MPKRTKVFSFEPLSGGRDIDDASLLYREAHASGVRSLIQAAGDNLLRVQEYARIRPNLNLRGLHDDEIGTDFVRPTHEWPT